MTRCAYTDCRRPPVPASPVGTLHAYCTAHERVLLAVFGPDAPRGAGPAVAFSPRAAVPTGTPEAAKA